MATIPSTTARDDLGPPPVASGAERVPAWRPATRVAFRFCVVYFGLYILTTQLLLAFLNVPGIELPDLGLLPPVRPLVLWIGTHVLGFAFPASPPTTGTGDTLFGWALAFSLLLIAAVATVVWSAVARRTEYARLHGWFRLALRVALGATFLFYGFAKLIPRQMPIDDIGRLVEPFGNFSPMGVLWASVGAAPAYEIALGCAEALGGLLLFFPATALVGALLCLLDGTMVFLMNMTYDVNVKLFSFHLVVMTLLLLAPNARPLFDLAVRHRTGAFRPEPAVGGSAAARRRIVIALAAYGVYTAAVFLYQGVRTWTKYGPSAPYSAVYGIWEVDSMAVGGVTRAPLLSDSTRWRRIILQDASGAKVQRMDDSFRQFREAVDSSARSLTLTDSTSGSKSVLGYRRVDRAHLLLDGTVDGRDVHLALTLRDPESFLLRRWGFHWISEVPFNR